MCTKQNETTKGLQDGEYRVTKAVWSEAIAVWRTWTVAPEDYKRRRQLSKGMARDMGTEVIHPSFQDADNPGIPHLCQKCVRFLAYLNGCLY